VFDGQPTVEVLVYQGEDPDALNNIEIGRFRVEGLRARERFKFPDGFDATGVRCASEGSGGSI
jgi:molecular chaperone DnaK (HSP70)